VTPNEKALVAAVGEKSRSALSEIYRRYGGAVWSVAKRVCRSDEQAESVSQAVFTELWSDPGRFDPSRGGLRACLVAEAHTRAIALVRSSAASGAAGSSGSSGASGSDEASVPVGAVELSAEARRFVDRLPADEREAILHAYFGGRAYMESARSHIRRGLLNLRRTLEAEGVTT
jgi:RNA polymerase sigma-70 factor, ECF subfamily